MSRLISALAVSGLLIGALSIPAQATTQSKTKTVTFIIRGTANSSTPGPCSTGYADQCLGTTPSTSCKCVEFSASSVSGLGKGATADVSLTLDEDAKTSSPGCTPAFASVALTGTGKKGVPVTATLNVSLTTCKPVTSNNKDEVLGGFGIESGIAGPAALTGFGLVSGVHDGVTGAVTLKFSGPVTTTP